MFPFPSLSLRLRNLIYTLSLTRTHSLTKARAALRLQNAPTAVRASRTEHEAGLKKLKSDLKRTTALIKKVKTALGEEQREVILR